MYFRMKRVGSLAVLAVAASVISAVSLIAIGQAAPVATQQTVTATANIVQQLTIAPTGTNVLSFGDLVAPPAGCSFTLSPGGTVPVATGAGCIALGSGNVNSPSFAVTGSPNKVFTVSPALGDSSATNGGSAGPQQVLLSGAANITNHLVLNPLQSGLGPSGSTGTLDANGNLTFTLGGVLSIPANTPQDVYSSGNTFVISIAYQ